jgi:hypothetical protein
VPFLTRGLALPASPFFCGLLDFYDLNLTHLNPNSILQIAIFVHLCEAFLISGFENIFTTVGPGWPEDNINLLVVPAWSFVGVGK